MQRIVRCQCLKGRGAVESSLHLRGAVYKHRLLCIMYCTVFYIPLSCGGGAFNICSEPLGLKVKRVIS